ncbi:LamG domain-containing protein [Mesorhizobium sp. M1B.F.Ca.ET.045.04.1.1]|uniref:LamG domain-containing protein n=1 Tax=Mesorhizobium sp. M1B.F.Ca.ET.045.04.1.1 TaxID=2493673 RepID=UPI000F75E656|nr:LamG domain-containing protein [Mesorhizobium sp. M1B.F.Ca.ET.045.04.1.1]AZO29439.1 LamG domain-containing protein [Mesorhizobium sp. M1B.F.Ca.ET.045.04.1.1]
MLPHMIGRRGPGRAVIVGDTGGSGGVSDGGFVDQPVVTTTSSGDTTIKGKVKSGSFGKFVVPLATVAAGRQYTFRYTPNFSQLAQQGKLAMVGFGFKNSNDFHIFGLRGDGSTGLNKYQVYGTPPSGWNAQTGHTVNDGGAAASGTQAGPNYIRLITSDDGTTCTLKSSVDGSTWNTEFSDASLSPFSNVSGVTTFGVALWFNNADAGPFSITIDQFADALAPDQYFSSVKLLLGFEGTDGATTTTDESPVGRSVTFNGNAQIDTAQAKFGSSSCLFDGSGDYLSMADSADWDLSDANSDQFTIEFWIRPHANVSNQRVMGQAPASGNIGWYINSTFTAAPTSVISFNYTSNGTAVTGVGVGSVAMALDTWHFIAITKNASGKIRLWVNGTLDDSKTPADSSIFNSTGAFEIGRSFATANFNGWLDEVRITKGVCRYDTDGSISVPTKAFPRS